MSLMSMGISHAQVQRAIEEIKLGKFGWHNDTRSKNTYIVCPIENTLWDLKPVVGLVWEDISETIRPREWVTTTFEKDLLKLGFTLVKFTELKGRKLGINDCDLSELNDEHTVYWPNGTIELNGFTSTIVQIRDALEKRQTTVNRHIRNSKFAFDVKARAEGKCDACDQITFQTPLGEWFLEVHHKQWLSEGGVDEESNMVALCPNCHRQEHHGRERKYK